MKILIIMEGFFPGKKYGGPPVSVDNFCSLLKNDCMIFIYTTNHDLKEKSAYSTVTSDIWIDRGNCKIKYVSESKYLKNNFNLLIDEIKPDILYLQGIFESCVLSCLLIAKKKKVKVLLAPRGELCDGALKIHRYKKLPYILLLRFFGLLKKHDFQSTSDEETKSIHKLLKVPYERIHFLSNIPSMPAKEYSRQLKIAGRGRFIFLSRIHPKKNLITAISLLDEVKGDVTFDIYGPIEDSVYWNVCKKKIEKSAENVKINYYGLVSHDEVHEIFSKYDAFLFPTLSENFGHVIAESLIVGTPVIISDKTPWSDVNEAQSCFSYSLEDRKSFKKAIQQIIDTEDLHSDSIKKYINSKLDIEKLRNEYKQVIEKIENGR